MNIDPDDILPFCCLTNNLHDISKTFVYCHNSLNCCFRKELAITVWEFFFFINDIHRVRNVNFKNYHVTEGQGHIQTRSHRNL